MVQQVEVDPSARADDPVLDRARDDGTSQITPDLAYRRLGIVNVIFFGERGAKDREWVLIDAGLFGTKSFIARAAAERFGPDSRPAAIILTHGHFDHVGVLEDLAREWSTPVVAHPLEQPYLNGSTSYPRPDPLVGGGVMALSSALFPRGPVDVSKQLHALPEDGTVPYMPGWRWLATPGHSPGHTSFWRERDRTLIVGDAFITTAQESVYAALTQEPELHGPPMYYTPDWASARASVRKLEALRPETVVTGHGRPMQGPSMREALGHLAAEFDSVAVPKHGRYSDTAKR